jgi:thiamine pyrophosphate-dependent acetolactate synthase large subunit-like protein
MARRRSLKRWSIAAWTSASQIATGAADGYGRIAGKPAATLLHLDVTTVIYANRSYAILNIELQRVGVGAVGSRALSMLDLHNPEMNWAKIASGLGVEASRASSAEEFASQFGSAMKHRRPRLIEAVI